jgi:hypothetical protein
MGPRIFTRGNGGQNAQLRLQVIQLQWGRGFSPAETLRKWVHWLGRKSTFTEAADYIRGNNTAQCPESRLSRASMGPQTHTRRNVKASR